MRRQGDRPGARSGCPLNKLFPLEPVKTRVPQIERIDEDINHADRIALVDPVIEALRQPHPLRSIRPCNAPRHRGSHVKGRPGSRHGVDERPLTANPPHRGSPFTSNCGTWPGGNSAPIAADDSPRPEQRSQAKSGGRHRRAGFGCFAEKIAAGEGRLRSSKSMTGCVRGLYPDRGTFLPSSSICKSACRPARLQ
jgi:hypothetical protein